jgi:hypothetical protein
LSAAFALFLIVPLGELRAEIQIPESLARRFAGDLAIIQNPRSQSRDVYSATNRIASSQDPQLETLWLSLIERDGPASWAGGIQLKDLARAHEFAPQTEEQLLSWVFESDSLRPQAAAATTTGASAAPPLPRVWAH